MKIKLHFIILILLTGFLAVEFIQYEKTDPASYQSIHSILNQIIRLDTSSEESMLQLQSQQLNNYLITY